MKRYFSLLLIVLLLPALLAVPARADEVTESGWINILDYGFANGSSSNYFSLTASSSEKTLSLHYNSPGGVYLYDYDIIFRTDASSVRIGASASFLTVIDLGDGLYRAYGSHNAASVNAFFDFRYVSASYFEVLSFKASTVSSIYRQLSGNLTVLAFNGTRADANFVGNGPVTAEWDMAGTGYDSRAFSSYLEILGNVEAYDFIDVNLTLFVEDIESISVDDGYNSLPFEVNEIYQATANNPYSVNTVITLRIDVRGLASGYRPVVRVTGACTSNYNRFTISYIGGILVIDPPSSLTYWFTQVGLWFSEQTNSLVSSFSSGFDALRSNLNANFGQLKDNIDANIQIIRTNLNNNFSQLKDKIDSFSSSVGSWFNQQITAVQTWGQNLKDSIDALPDKIAEALKALMVPSDSAIQDFGEKSEEIAQDRFGGVYEGAVIVDQFAGQLQAQAATQVLTVPVVQLSILGSVFPLGGWEVDLVPDGAEPIIEACKLIIDIIATLAFINGLKSRLERTLEQ